ncbi:MAG: DNA polymerase I [Nitrospinae bacterium]|jgi:DNA polymerase I|nr:DNA polymerase I [Nitrospinota bacterium]MBL7021572.1 DNA polymerase I [Nitrospinaceae bacterium]
MISLGSKSFRQVWLVDFEFVAPDGERPDQVVCLVAKELVGGHTMRLWEDELRRLKLPPYPVGADSLFVAYYASAEFNCHLSLGWPLPENVLDLFTEFRCVTNGKTLSSGSGLLGALTHFGLPCLDVVEKDAMRNLILSGGPWSQKEQEDIFDYCESDVVALEKLLPHMAPHLNIPHSLLRGRYMKAAAQIEYNGIPIDVESLALLENGWDSIQEQLIRKMDADYGVYEGKTFKQNKFAAWLVGGNIPWPHLPTGKLDLKDDTFKEMSRSYPAVGPLRELRVTLSQMRLSALAVGKDGRNRCMLSAFRAKTGRNQPSNKRFIFGPAVWLRSLIKPNTDYGLAYIDWSQQEFGIAAALSKDPLMMEAYRSGDPYLAFAKQAGAVPDNATKQSHKFEREQFKACVLAVQYGMGAESLAVRINQPVVQARELLKLHRTTYKVFWGWSAGVLNHAMLMGKIWTVFGWEIHIGKQANPRSLQNFPMQANGAEMLRLACCLAVESGIRVCAPVHDAILVEAPLNELDECIAKTQELMAQASEIVLDGFRLRSDVDITRYPDRYMDERGEKMWNTIWDCLNEMGSHQPVRQ